MFLCTTVFHAQAATATHLYGSNLYHFLAEVVPRVYYMLPVLRAHPAMQLLVTTRVMWWWLDVFFPDDALRNRSVVRMSGL